MRKPLAISFTLHALLLGWAIFVIPPAAPLKVDPQDMIPVDIVSIEDFSKRKAMTKAEEPKKAEKPKPKPAETAEPPAPKVEPEVKKAAKEPTAAEEPPPEPVKKAEPEPQPDQTALAEILRKNDDEQALQEKVAAEAKAAAEAQEKAEAEAKRKAEAEAKKKAEAEAKMKAEAEVKKKAEARKKAEAEKKKKIAKLDVDEISNFLDKVDDDSAAPLKPTEEAGEPERSVANVSGSDDKLAATLIDALRQRLSQCWNIPPGAREAELVVRLRFNLNQQGRVLGEPEILNGSSSPLFSVTAQSAVSAVLECQSYDFLPADKYDLWREITINFNPNQMSRS